MSTIWTPSGERPIRRESEPEPAPPRSSPHGADRGVQATHAAGEEITEEELAARMMDVQRQLLETPAAVVIANHAIGLFQLAVLHLEQQPPNLGEAKLAIDAMASLVETLGPRLGEDAASLREALAQLQIGYVQRRQMAAGGTPPPAE